LPNATVPDPLARLRAVSADVSSALQFFSGLFGPPVLNSLTVSPIPGGFGQSFPGLVYLSTLSYLDANERPASARGPREQVFYSDLLDAHEVAHQWWGGMVLTAGDQDEWLSEALADYSALLYLEKRKGAKAMEDVLEEYRDTLLSKDSGKDTTIESAGPITWGFRLESAGSAEAWRAITYDKGAWIFHMLRRRMGDAQFLKMLAELRRRFESRRLSTAGLRELVKEYLPPQLKPAKIDAFFDNWVYSSGIPTLKLRYTVKGVAPSVKISGQVEQSGVDDDFSVEAPVEIQFAKGASQTIWVETSSSAASFSATLKQVPLKVSIPAGTGVLALKK
jgi:aminopeptidase N